MTWKTLRMKRKTAREISDGTDRGRMTVFTEDRSVATRSRTPSVTTSTRTTIMTRSSCQTAAVVRNVGAGPRG